MKQALISLEQLQRALDVQDRVFADVCEEFARERSRALAVPTWALDRLHDACRPAPRTLRPIAIVRSSGVLC